MLPGPVFEFELVTTARRGRYYLARVAYALFVLMVLGHNHSIWIAFNDGSDLTLRQVRLFALSTFGWLVALQVLAILLITPALVSGVIAEEKQRRTLQYLLTSSLNSSEIIVGKLLARLLHLFVFLMVSLPVLCMVVLIGGLDVRAVLIGFAAALSTAVFVASLSLLVSTMARSVREAILVTYMLEVTWLVAPFVVEKVLLTVSNPVVDLLGRVNSWVLGSSPLGLGNFTSVMGIYATLMAGPAAMLENAVWMAASQMTLALFMVLIASNRLRPIYRGQDDAPRGRLRAFLRGRRSWRLWPRPACGDDPMGWKERYTTRSTGLLKLVGLTATIIFGTLLAYVTLKSAVPAFEEAVRWNYKYVTRQWFSTQNRYFFHQTLSIVLPFTYLAWILGIVAVAAGGVTSERERDTWTSLTATDLTAREILFAKMRGAVGSLRRVGFAIVLLWMLGLVCGVLGPFGFVVNLLAVVAFTWFGVALGTCLSLVVPASRQAQFLSVGLFLIVNIIGQTLLGLMYQYAPMIWPGFTPVVISRTLYEPGTLESFGRLEWWHVLRSFSIVSGDSVWEFALDVASIILYAIGGWALTRLSLRLFDRAAGRPQRATRAEPPFDSTPEPPGEPLASVELAAVPAGPAS